MPNAAYVTYGTAGKRRRRSPSTKQALRPEVLPLRDGPLLNVSQAFEQAFNDTKECYQPKVYGPTEALRRCKTKLVTETLPKAVADATATDGRKKHLHIGDDSSAPEAYRQLGRMQRAKMHLDRARQMSASGIARIRKGVRILKTFPDRTLADYETHKARGFIEGGAKAIWNENPVKEDAVKHLHKAYCLVRDYEINPPVPILFEEGQWLPNPDRINEDLVHTNLFLGQAMQPNRLKVSPFVKYIYWRANVPCWFSEYEACSMSRDAAEDLIREWVKEQSALMSTFTEQDIIQDKHRLHSAILNERLCAREFEQRTSSLLPLFNALSDEWTDNDAHTLLRWQMYLKRQPFSFPHSSYLKQPLEILWWPDQPLLPDLATPASSDSFLALNDIHQRFVHDSSIDTPVYTMQAEEEEEEDKEEPTRWPPLDDLATMERDIFDGRLRDYEQPALTTETLESKTIPAANGPWTALGRWQPRLTWPNPIQTPFWDYRYSVTLLHSRHAKLAELAAECLEEAGVQNAVASSSNADEVIDRVSTAMIPSSSAEVPALNTFRDAIQPVAPKAPKSLTENYQRIQAQLLEISNQTGEPRMYLEQRLLMHALVLLDAPSTGLLKQVLPEGRHRLSSAATDVNVAVADALTEEDATMFASKVFNPSAKHPNPTQGLLRLDNYGRPVLPVQPGWERVFTPVSEVAFYEDETCKYASDHLVGPLTLNAKFPDGGSSKTEVGGVYVEFTNAVRPFQLYRPFSDNSNERLVELIQLYDPDTTANTNDWTRARLLRRAKALLRSANSWDYTTYGIRLALDVF